jgi:hypothetical protein
MRRWVILLLAAHALAGCVSIIQLSPAPPSAKSRLLPVDQETAWTALLQVIEQREIPILESEKKRGWLQTDFVYFRPMDFGVPILEGALFMGSYLDVTGGRYRLAVRIKSQGRATSVNIDTQLERLEKRQNQNPQTEPSYSFDSPIRRGYLVRVPQPSNGVIEERLFRELEVALAERQAVPSPATNTQ